VSELFKLSLINPKGYWYQFIK